MSQISPDDITDMKSLGPILLFVCMCHGPSVTQADEVLPLPRKLFDDEYGQFSTSEFERLLQMMKAEREALRSDWQTLVKKTARPASTADIDRELHMHMKQILEHLQKRNPPPAQQPPPPSATEPPPQTHDLETMKTEPIHGSTPPKTTVGEMPGGKSSPILNLSAQANALFRSRQFEEALTTYRLIDLKGQKADVRAPVQYLMAQCMIHLGKTDEALPLLREVANSRGDDKLAGSGAQDCPQSTWFESGSLL